MKNRVLSFVLLFIFMTAGTAAAADAGQWTVDPAHSGIYFNVNHIYSKVHGFFHDYKADIVFDPDNLAAARFYFTVTVKSIDTNNTKRDGHLLSGDFFDAGKYPIMTFESKSIRHLNGNAYTMQGLLTIKDVSRTIDLPFTFFGTKPNPLNPKQEVAGFETRWSIDRLAYHVGSGKYYDMGVVGKEVDILISIEATRDK